MRFNGRKQHDMTTDARIYAIWNKEKGNLILNVNIVHKYINKLYLKKVDGKKRSLMILFWTSQWALLFCAPLNTGLHVVTPKILQLLLLL